MTARYMIYMGRDITNLYKSDTYSSSAVFASHKTLSLVEIGNSVTRIYPGLFRNCISLESIISSSDNLKIIDEDAFRGCTQLWQISDNVLKSIEQIGSYAFSECPQINNIYLHNIKEMGIGAFSCYNGKLENAYIGDALTSIPENCFNSQSNLKNVYIGNSVTSIGKLAFRGCEKLIYLYIFSENLTTIGEEAIPTSVSKIFVPNPSRYDNLFNGYYKDYLIIIDNTTFEYSGNIPQFSYRNNVIGASIAFDSNNVNINSGVYNTKADVSFNFSNGLSLTATVPIAYTITPVQLTIIPENVSRQYGSANPELTCSFFGFKNNETAEVLTRLPNVETTATVNSPVGTYPIIATGAEAQNYSFTYERGILTVTKADQEIEWDQSFGTVNVGDVVELTATSTSGLPIKYTATDESIAEIYSQGGKKFVEFLKPGTVSIRANQEGNENYNEADRVSKSVTVASLVKDVILNQTSVNLNEGDTYQLTAIISPSDAPNKTLEWSSSNTEVATVDANGKITAIKQGQATITAKTADGSNITATCEVKVLKLVSDIVLNVSSASLAEGQTLQLNATITPEQADDKTLLWISSNEAIATVDQSGLVTAVAKGSAKIRVEAVDGSGVYAECDVEVYAYSGIDTISVDGIQITTEPFIATIQGVEEGTTIRLFDMSGNILYLGSEPRVEVGQTGIYILVVNNKAYKIKL